MRGGYDADMCSIVEIRADALAPSEAKRIAARSEFLSVFDRALDFSLHGCDLLSDDADWDARTWDMSAEAKAALHDALRVLFDEYSGQVTLTALWWEGADASPVPMQAVTREEVLSLVDANAISTESGFEVSADRLEAGAKGPVAACGT